MEKSNRRYFPLSSILTYYFYNTIELHIMLMSSSNRTLSLDILKQNQCRQIHTYLTNCLNSGSKKVYVY